MVSADVVYAENVPTNWNFGGMCNCNITNPAKICNYDELNDLLAVLCNGYGTFDLAMIAIGIVVIALIIAVWIWNRYYSPSGYEIITVGMDASDDTLVMTLQMTPQTT